MEVTSLLWQAANLMLTGMVVVFLFLLLLIWAIKLMSAVVGHFDVAPEVKPINLASQNTSVVPAAHIAAITGAIKQYRLKHKK